MELTGKALLGKSQLSIEEKLRLIGCGQGENFDSHDICEKKGLLTQHEAAACWHLHGYVYLIEHPEYYAWVDCPEFGKDIIPKEFTIKEYGNGEKIEYEQAVEKLSSIDEGFSQRERIDDNDELAQVIKRFS